jgi:hypothetical protein
MDIGKCFRDAWGLFKLDIGPRLVTALVAAVIAGVARRVIVLAVGGSVLSTRAGWFGGGVGVVSGFFASFILAVVFVLVYAWFIATALRMLVGRVRQHRPADYADLQDFTGAGAVAVAATVLGLVMVVGYALLVIPGSSPRRCGSSRCPSWRTAEPASPMRCPRASSWRPSPAISRLSPRGSSVRSRWPSCRPS